MSNVQSVFFLDLSLTYLLFYGYLQLFISHSVYLLNWCVWFPQRLIDGAAVDYLLENLFMNVSFVNNHPQFFVYIVIAI